MQPVDAERLKKAWGNKPCDHPDTEKEHARGISTGDYVCTQCGATFSSRADADDARRQALERAKDQPSG